jgi:hypothetical protein
VDNKAAQATPDDVILRDLLDINKPKNEREHLAVRAIEELWHFAICPFDHCTRCAHQERFIKLIRDTVPSWHQLNEP